MDTVLTPSKETVGDLAQTVEKILDKGLVLNADITVSVAGTELLGIKIRAALASFETAARYGLEFPSGTNLNAPAWRKLMREETAEREPFIDVIDEPDSIKVLMEAVGMERRDISVRILERQKLVIATSKGEKVVSLPCPVAGEPVASLRHGTLEVMAKKHAH